MIETISLREALKLIELKDKDGGQFPFSVSFRTLNKQSRTGGKLVSYENAKLFRASKSASRQLRAEDMQAPQKARKKPNHFLNRTRNIEQQNGQISKIHIRLIDSINGKKIVF